MNRWPKLKQAPKPLRSKPAPKPPRPVAGPLCHHRLSYPCPRCEVEDRRGMWIFFLALFAFQVFIIAFFLWLVLR